MLIQLKSGQVKLAPGDITEQTAAELVAAGDAVEVSAIRVLRETRVASPTFTGKFKPGDVVDVGPACPAEVARVMLRPEHTAARFDTFADAEVYHRPAVKPEEKSQ